jgi:ubiquitin-protein ligase
MGPRKQVRLQKDLEELMRLKSSRSDLIDFTSRGSPPTEYLFTIRLKGLKLDGDKAVVTELHQFQLRLGSNYPSEPPDVTWQTPIFHPNIRGQAVCHSQQWSPAWSLADFVIEIGDMVRMHKLNVKSPLDRKAAAWAEANQTKFPLDERSLRPPEVRISIRPKSSAPAAPAPPPQPQPGSTPKITIRPS